jgi:hypothetical protein
MDPIELIQQRTAVGARENAAAAVPELRRNSSSAGGLPASRVTAAGDSSSTGPPSASAARALAAARMPDARLRFLACNMQQRNYQHRAQQRMS